MYKGFNETGFIGWMKETFQLNNYSMLIVGNVIEYAHKNKHISKDQFAYFVSDMLPYVEFLDVAKFCEDDILTDGTLKALGRK